MPERSTSGGGPMAWLLGLGGGDLDRWLGWVERAADVGGLLADTTPLGAPLRTLFARRARGLVEPAELVTVTEALFRRALFNAVGPGRLAAGPERVPGLVSQRVDAAGAAAASWWWPVRFLFLRAPRRRLALDADHWRVRWGEGCRVVDRTLTIPGPEGGLQTRAAEVYGDRAMVAADYQLVRGREFKIGVGGLRFCFPTERGRADGATVGTWLDDPIDEDSGWLDIVSLGAEQRLPRAARGRVYAAVFGDFCCVGVEAGGREWWSWARPRWPIHRAPTDTLVPIVIETHEASAVCTNVDVFEPGV